MGNAGKAEYVDENGKVHIWVLIEANADRFGDVDIPLKEEVEDILRDPRHFLIEDYFHDSDVLIKLLEDA